MGILDKRRTGRKFIHQAFVYDLGVLIFGVPLGLYLCSTASKWLQGFPSVTNNAFLSSAVYVYLMFVGLWAYRLLFGYTKWAFPTVELHENEHNSKKHRAFWYTIIVGIAGKLLYDLLRAMS